MSLLDNYDVSVINPKINAITIRRIVNQVVWDLFDEVEDGEVKVKVWWIFRVKLIKKYIESYISKMVGPKAMG